MMLVPSTKVRLNFYTFEGANPPLYYAANDGTLTLASVNAGNSELLCVGLGGVNHGFFLALTQANQKNVNLNDCALQGSLDDYQSRHLKLLAKATAAATKTAFESYTPTDPCAFSFADASLVGNTPGWYEGVCFVDVFDPALRPAGNANNVAMIYVAPPFGGHYTTDAIFLAAIEATARNIIRTIAGYNAIAAQNKLPVIEALRSTLYSSVLYNPNNVPHDDIARAIYAGYAAELKNTTNSGLVELQFPTADPLFWALQTLASGQPANPSLIAAAAAAAAPVMMLFQAGDGGVEVDDPVEELPDFDVASGEDAVAISKSLDFGARSTVAEANAVKALADSLIGLLKSGGALKPTDPLRYAIKSPDFTTEPIVKTAPKGKSEPVKKTSEYASAAQMKAIRANAPEAAYNDSSFSQLHLSEGDGTGGTGGGGGGGDNQGGVYGPFPKKGVSPGAKAWILIAVGALAHFAFYTAVAACIAFAAGGFKKKSKLVLDQPKDLPAPSTQDQLLAVQATITDLDASTPLDTGSVTFTAMTTATPPSAVGTALTVPVDAKGVAAASFTVPANTATGSYALTATYSGTYSGLVYDASTDTKNFGVGAVTQLDTTTTISTPAADGSTFNEGSTLNVAASVTANGMALTTGSVTFSLNATPSVSVTLPLDNTGKASGSLTLPAQGSYALTATFAPDKSDTTHKSSSAQRTLTVVAAATPTITQSPADAWIVVGGSVTLTAAANPSTATVVTVQWQLSTDGGSSFTPIPGETNLSLTLTNLTLTQTKTQYRAVFTNAGLSATTKPATLTVSPVVYLGPDTTSQSDWTSKYGAQGYRIATGVPADNPAFAAISALPTNTFTYSQGPTRTDPRQLPADPQSSSYIAATFVPIAGKDSFEVTVTANDGKPHQIALYMLDWDKNNRVQSITFSDSSGATKYDTRTFLNFEDGVYGLWNFSGSVKITVQETGTNPVLWGIFIDAAHTAADFRLDAAATTVTVGGGTSNLIIPTIPANGFNGAITLAATNWPSGITATFDPKDPLALTATITVDSTVLEGRYPLLLTATSSGSFSTTTTLLLGVKARRMPMLRHTLLAADVTTGQAGAVDVLARGESFHPKDPKSVMLTGIQDSGGSTASPMALVGTDGKSLRVDGEGIWLVDQQGLVAFVADAGLDHPPTPVAVCFSDVQGNKSNNALIVIDPALDQVAPALKALNKLDDTAFWKRFQKVMIDDPAVDLDLETVAAALIAMLQSTGLAASTGPRNPVQEADFDAAYQKWLGTQKSLRSLKSICISLVDQALPQPPPQPTQPQPPPPQTPAPLLRARFWTLISMLQMTRQALGVTDDV